MASDILNEQRLTLSQAAQKLNLHTSTLHRWRLRGVRGIRLSTALIGAVRYTSEERLQDFIERTTAAADGTCLTAHTSKHRQRQIEAAEKELAEAGI